MTHVFGLQNACYEVDRLQQDRAWMEVRKLRSENEVLKVSLNATNQEVVRLQQWLRDEKAQRQEVETALREERKLWADHWGIQ